MPNKELLQKWVNWLETHGDEQGIGGLHYWGDGQGDRFCCLGGLGCVLNVDWHVCQDAPDGSYKRFSVLPDGTYYTVLPYEIWEQLGIRETQDAYWEMNDKSRKSFKEIATYIRKKYLEVDHAE